MDSSTWSLKPEEREATVERIAKNISSIAFFKGLEVSDAAARQAAVAAEKKAYTAAQVAARTTTGNRPHAETTSGYARWVHAINTLLIMQQSPSFARAYVFAWTDSRVLQRPHALRTGSAVPAGSLASWCLLLWLKAASRRQLLLTPLVQLT